MVEVVIRSAGRLSSFLLIHHTLYCVFVLLATAGDSVVAVKVDLITDLFATYEVNHTPLVVTTRFFRRFGVCLRRNTVQSVVQGDKPVRRTQLVVN